MYYPKERSYELVKKLSENLDETVVEFDIDICYEVLTSEANEKNIVVRFVQRIKINALAKSKEKRVNADFSGFSGVACSLYDNGRLTIQNKQLLGAAIGGKKTAG